MTLRAYKYRFYPNAEQADTLGQTFGCTRFVYNKFLAYSTEQYDLGNKTSYSDWSKELTKLKTHTGFEWLKEVPSVPLQQALRNLDKAYKTFFKNVSTGNRVGTGKGKGSVFGYPVLKSKCKKQSATYTSGAFKWDEENQNLYLAKMKQPLKIRWSRKFEGKPSSVYVTKTPTDKYYVSILVKEAIQPKKAVNKTVGVDIGIKTLGVCSDGVEFENPKATYKYAKKLAKAQRKLSKKKKGSNNFKKQKLKVAKICDKIANVRKDFTHKMTSKLINENQVISLETLKVKDMVKNKRLAKAISDANFGEIVRQLEYKAEWYGRTISKISQWFPSSKMCNSCGSLYSGTWTLNVREWTCDCGKHHDRDLNAAINIHNEGLRLLN